MEIHHHQQQNNNNFVLFLQETEQYMKLISNSNNIKSSVCVLFKKYLYVFPPVTPCLTS